MYALLARIIYLGILVYLVIYDAVSIPDSSIFSPRELSPRETSPEAVRLSPQVIWMIMGTY